MRIFLLVLFFLPSVCFSAQDTTVVVDNAPIRAEPKAGGKVLEYLSIGMEIRISSFPMDGGWYKARSSSGLYGWVHQKFLSIGQRLKKNAQNLEEGEAPKDEIAKPERDRKFFVRILGGFDFFSPGDLNAAFDFNELNTGNMIGTEMGYFLADRVAALVRFEAVIKDVVAREKISGLNFDIGIRSYPIMAGFDFFIAKLPAMRLSLGIFGGLAVATSFASEAPALAAPNTSVLQRTPFTSIARLNLTRPLGRILSVFGEVGYRYLKTEPIPTTGTADVNGGTQIYGQNGTYKPRVIDLSGIIVGIGVGIHF